MTARRAAGRRRSWRVYLAGFEWTDMRSLRFYNLAPVFSVVLLVGIGMTTWMRPGPEDAQRYHEHVHEVAEGLAYRVGPWLGERVAAPAEARQLLRANVLRTIAYTHVDTGEQATLLFVHTKEASDLAGHYPPRCYPNQGWTQAQATPRDWTVGQHTISGMQYTFTYERPLHTERMVVANFMIMPDGRFLRNTAGVYAAAADYTTRFYGAAQVQLVTSAGVSDSRRDEIFQELIGAAMPAIDAVRFGRQVVAQQTDASGYVGE